MATFALIRNDVVHQIFDADPHLGDDFDVRDVSDVTGIDQGWVVKKNGSYSAPDHPAANPADPVIPGSATKLGLKRALAETGDKAVFSSPQWQAVKDLLSKDADLQEEWDLAIEVKASDPVVQGAVKALKWKTAQVNALIVRANELVA